MLTQGEADALLAMEKRFADLSPVLLEPGMDVTRELIGADRRERFQFDVWRGTIQLSKLRLQTRARKIVVLARLDIDGSPHTNPDGQRFDGTHLHLYRKGYETRWAYPVDAATFSNLSNRVRTFDDFCRFCNILDLPPVQEGLL